MNAGFFQTCLIAEKLLIQQGCFHRILDVLFHEDDAHVRLGHAAAALNMLREMALQLLKAAASRKESPASKRLRCAWVFSYAIPLFSYPLALAGADVQIDTHLIFC